VAYDGAQMVAAWGADSVTWSAQWAPGLDNLVSVRMGATGHEAFAVKDGRGNVTGYYRGQGSNAGLWLSAEYTPEGRVTQKDWVSGATCVETGTTQCPRMGGVPFGFHSAYKSPAHGLLYFRNRWYSVEAGQWLSQDPLGEVDSANLYAFNRFDSVNFVDPLGLESEGPALDSGSAHMDVGKTSGFNEDTFDMILFLNGHYDHLFRDGKGTTADHRKPNAWDSISSSGNSGGSWPGQIPVGKGIACAGCVAVPFIVADVVIGRKFQRSANRVRDTLHEARFGKRDQTGTLNEKKPEETAKPPERPGVQQPTTPNQPNPNAQPPQQPGNNKSDRPGRATEAAKDVKFTKEMNAQAAPIARGDKIDKVGVLVEKFGGPAKDWSKMKTRDANTNESQGWREDSFPEPGGFGVSDRDRGEVLCCFLEGAR
jgi:RHS repeat-associated protein